MDKKIHDCLQAIALAVAMGDMQAAVAMAKEALEEGVVSAAMLRKALSN
jgi:hypothetical protein